MMNNLPFLLVVLHKPTLWPSTFNPNCTGGGGGGGGLGDPFMKNFTVEAKLPHVQAHCLVIFFCLDILSTNFVKIISPQVTESSK